MSLAEHKLNHFQAPAPYAMVVSRTAIRLPGVPGEVMWNATLDLDHECLKEMEIRFPNGTVDNIHFDPVSGVSVERHAGEQPVKLSPSMIRQALAHARIIAGLHLQVMMENGSVHHV